MKKHPDWLLPLACIVLGAPLLFVGVSFDDRSSLIMYYRMFGGILILVGVISSLLALPAIAGAIAYRWHKNRND